MNLIKKNSCLLLLALLSSPSLFAQGLGTKAALSSAANNEPAPFIVLKNEYPDNPGCINDGAAKPIGKDEWGSDMGGSFSQQVPRGMGNRRSDDQQQGRGAHL